MSEKIKNLINMFFELFGYKLQCISKTVPVDLRLLGNDPRILRYLGHQQEGIIEARICRGRGLPIFSFLKGEGHPYVYAISLIEDDKKRCNLDLIKTVLSKYYDSVKPVSASDILGLDSQDIEGFNEEPSWSALMPWNSENLEEWKLNIQRSVVLENYMYIKNLTIKDGWAWVGPVSNEKLMVESTRLNNVYNSIVKNGYQRNNGADGDVLAVVLIDTKGNWCWQAITGQHRACVLAGLGYEKITIRIVKIILESEAEYWPNVKSGLYPVAAALKVFNLVMQGGTPEVVKPWCESIKNKNAI